MTFMLISGQHDTQQQETHDKAQRQRTSVTHEYFLSLTPVAKDIIKPERQDNAKGRKGYHGINQLALQNKNHAEDKKGYS